MIGSVHPVVSVCVITYNQEAFIAQTLDSIVKQVCSFRFEVVIGEDDSKDSTREICERYAEDYPEIIRLLPKERNLGMNPNFIRTLAACNGKYIAVCEGDDYWTDPYKLEKQVVILEANEDYSACIANAKLINENGEFIRLYLNGLNEGVVNKEFLIKRGGASYPTASIVFRNNKSIVDTLLKVEELAGDNKLIIALAILGEVFFVDEVMCIYRIWQGGVYTRTVKDPMETTLRKKNTVAGLKKMLKIAEGDIKKNLRKRISVESLFVIEHNGIVKNLALLFDLNIKDMIKLLLFLIGLKRKMEL